MDLIRKPIGGEFWFDEKLQSHRIINNIRNNEVLLNGGKSSIELILSSIDFKQDEVILLPTYLCPTIVGFVENMAVKYEFYNINKDLSINMDNVNELIRIHNVKAVFFIDYFGFYNNRYTRDKLLEIRKAGVILIEDAVQMFWMQKKKYFIGDYIFNSYRKFLPIDGSVVIGINNLVFEELEDDYYTFMKDARNEKTIYINQGIGDEEKILKDFDFAHEKYYVRNSINSINSFDKEFLSHLPIETLNDIRINNYKYLKEALKDVVGIKIILDDELEDNVPLCIPVLIDNRNLVRRSLMKFNIYCPIHWVLNEEKWISNFDDALYVSNRILSIPIDWRYNTNDMQYIADCLKIILN